jgi:hypothetical protein
LGKLAVISLPLSLPTWLNNLVARIDTWLTREPYLTNRDGRMVPIDDWDGYDECMRPGCGHYHCEHSHGEVWETTYVNPALKEPHFKVGDMVSYPVGCMNSGCKCPGFWNEADLHTFVRRLNAARINGSHDLRQVPGVTRVESDVDIFTESIEETARDVLYTEEAALYDKHPDVLFDFHVRWDKPPQN